MSGSDLDLSAMNGPAAREYVLEFVRSLKETERQLAHKQEELDKWRGRVTLAEKAERADLAAGARAKAEALAPEVEVLRKERAALEVKIDVLKEQLQSNERRFKHSIDADALLSQLTLLSGEPDTTDEEIRRTEAELELERLKKSGGE